MRRDQAAARDVAQGSALLSLAVLADSAIEHYHGSFRNPAMVLPLSMASLSLLADRDRPAGALRTGTRLGSIVTGFVGLGFHLFNVAKRPGGLSFSNLFYGAPLGAPAALILAGATGAVADTLRRRDIRLLRLDLGDGRAIGGLAAAGLLGTCGEAGFLHLRGAFHNPAMWLPVSLPPLAALSLGRDVIRGAPSRFSRVMLRVTAGLGLIGTSFHVLGVGRNMGGWRNWRQNLLAGPPTPAPIAFTGLALVGLGALALMRSRHD